MCSYWMVRTSSSSFPIPLLCSENTGSQSYTAKPGGWGIPFCQNWSDQRKKRNPSFLPDHPGVKYPGLVTHTVHLIIFVILLVDTRLPGWLSGKESVCDAEDAGDAASLIPRLGRSPGGGHGNSLQFSFLENPIYRGAWWATAHRVAQSGTQLKWLSTHLLLDINV